MSINPISSNSSLLPTIDFSAHGRKKASAATSTSTAHGTPAASSTGSALSGLFSALLKSVEKVAGINLTGNVAATAASTAATATAATASASAGTAAVAHAAATRGSVVNTHA